MSSIHPSGRSANIVGSLQAYTNEQLENALNSTSSDIDYGGGASFKDSNLAEWIQFRTLAAVPIGESSYAPWSEESEPTDRARELTWVVNVNCFVRPGQISPSDNLRIWRLRDLVISAFREGMRIPVKDYAQADATLGYLFVTAVLQDRAIQDPARLELVQHNLVFALRWSDTWGLG